MSEIGSIGGLYSINFDDEAVVFNALSGELHLLPAVSEYLLFSYKSGAKNTELIEHMQKTYNYSPQQAEDLVCDYLASYKKLNLIE